MGLINCGCEESKDDKNIEVIEQELPKKEFSESNTIKNSTSKFDVKPGNKFDIHQLNQDGLMTIIENNKNKLCWITKSHELMPEKKVYDIFNYLYYQKEDIHIYIGGNNILEEGLKLRAIKKDKIIFESEKSIAYCIKCDVDVAGQQVNPIRFRSAGLIGSRIYGLDFGGKILMFDINLLKYILGYQPAVINADTLFCDIVSDGKTIFCLEQKGKVSRIVGNPPKHDTTQSEQLLGFSNAKIVYFTIAVGESVVIAASCSNKQNTIELLDYQSLKTKSSFVIPKEYKNGGALMKMKIFKKDQLHFIVGSTLAHHMYLLQVQNDQILQLEHKEGFSESDI